MWKRKTIWIYVFCFILVFTFVSAETRLLYDDFNRVNSDTLGNGWTESGSAGMAAIHNNSLSYNDTSGVASETYKRNINATTDTGITMDFEFRMEATVSGSSYYNILDLADSTETSFCDSLLMQNNDNLYYYDTDFRLISNITLNEFHDIRLFHNTSDNKVTVWINDIQEYHSTARTACAIGDFDKVIGAGQNAAQIRYRIDNINIYNGSITPPTPEPVANITNTSIYVADFNISDLIFATDTFFNAFTVEFNVSETLNVSLISSFNVVKNSGALSNTIFGRVLIDGTEQLSESLRTVSTTNDEGSTGFYPILTQLNSGQHNITVQFRRTGNGVIEINDIDFILIHFFSTQNNTIRVQSTTDDTTFANTDFDDVIIWEIETRANDTFFINKQTINATGESVSDYRFAHIDHDHLSSLVSRYLPDSSAIGSIGNTWLHEDSTESGNYSIFARTNQNTLQINTTILDFDLMDSFNNTIPVFEISNASTNISNNISLGQGSHLLVKDSLISTEGDSLFLAGTISFQSTSGTQTPVVVINSTNSSLDCYSKKERYLSSNDDIGNAYLFTICDGSIVQGSGYDFNLYVEIPSGETLVILDEILSGFETTQFNINDLPTEKIITVETDLINNTINFNNNSLLINYNFTIGIFNTIDQANCTLFVNEIVNQTQNDRNDSTNYQFNLSFGEIENDFNLSIVCNNSETTGSSGIFNYDIDTIQPRIETSFVNNSQFIQLDTITFDFNFTDNNLFAYNVTWFDSDGTILDEFFIENLTVTFAENISSRVATDTGNFTTRAQAWDSHNPVNKPHEKYKFIDESNKKVTFSNGFFKITDPNIDEWELEEEDNKYKEKFKFNDYSGSMILESDTQLLVVTNTDHKAHIISLAMRKYHDLDHPFFHVDNIIRISSTRIRIDYYIDELELTTESIGDLNFNEVTYSYTVTSGETLNTQLLQSINETLSSALLQQTEINGAINMLWIIVFTGIFLIVGAGLKQFWLWSFSSLGLLIVGVKFIVDNVTTPSQYNTIMAIVFIGAGIGLALAMGGLILLFDATGGILEKKTEKNKNKEFHIDY